MDTLDIQKCSLHSIEDEMILNSTKNMLHAISTIDVLFLKVLLDTLEEAFEGYYYYDFNEVSRNFINTKKYYKSLLEKERKDKELSEDLVKCKALAYHLYKKIRYIEKKNKQYGKEIPKINNTLKQILEQFSNKTNNIDMSNENLNKILVDCFYNTMKKQNLITESELNKLLN